MKSKKLSKRAKAARPRYSIRKHISFWAIDFDGQTAVFDHEQGAYYVAYLLLNPPAEPIHGLALELRALAFFGQYADEPCETFIVDRLTNETLAIGSDAAVVERSIGVDDAKAMAPLRRKIQELEAIL